MCCRTVICIVFVHCFLSHVPKAAAADETSDTSPYSVLITKLLNSESFASGLRACFPDAVGLPGVPAATAAVGCPYVGTNASVLAEALQQALSQDQAAKDAVCAVAPSELVTLPIFMSIFGWPMGQLLGHASYVTANTSFVFETYVNPIHAPGHVSLTTCATPNTGLGAGTPSTGEDEAENPPTPAAPHVIFGVDEAPWSEYLQGPDASSVSYWETKEYGHMDSTGKLRGLVWPRTHLMLFYRQDWFTQLNITAPNTWEELIAMAHALSALPGFHRTMYDYEPDPISTRPPDASATAPKPPTSSQTPLLNSMFPHNTTWPGWDLTSWPSPQAVPASTPKTLQGPLELDSRILSYRMPLCLDLAPYCKGGDLLAAISASMTQTRGLSQGWSIDPLSLRPLANVEAVRRAVDIMHALTLLSTPRAPFPFPTHTTWSPTSSCAATAKLFSAGACAMTIDWDMAFVFITNMQPAGLDPDLSGNIGTALLPGSPVVWARDGSSGDLDPLTECSPTTCPYATEEQTQVFGTPSAGSDSQQNASDAASSTSSHTVTFRNAKGGLVRRSVWPLLNSSSWEAAGVQRNSSKGVRVVKRLVNRAPYSLPMELMVGVCRTEGLPGEAISLLRAVVDPMVVVERVRTNAIKAGYMEWKAGGKSPTSNTTTLTPLTPATATALSNTTTSSTGSNPAGATRANSSSTSAPPGPRMQSTVTATRRLLQTAPSPPTLGVTNTNTTVLPTNRSYTFAYGTLTDWHDPNVPSVRLTTHPADSQRYLNALWKTRYVHHRNPAAGIVLTEVTTKFYRQAYGEAVMVMVAVPNCTRASISQGLEERLKYVINLQPGGNRTVQVALWALTDFEDQGVASTPGSPQIMVKRSHSVNLVAAIVAPIVALVAIVAIATAVLFHVRRTQHLTLRGTVVPPKTGPATTLVVTDIQDSTTLWEQCLPGVMDKALGLHHALIRRLAIQHAGYESATEGDSFILAFHCPGQAALFAVEVQHKLLQEEWPEELLDIQVCKPVYVTPMVHGGGGGGGFNRNSLKHAMTETDLPSTGVLSALAIPAPANEEQCVGGSIRRSVGRKCNLLVQELGKAGGNSRRHTKNWNDAHALGPHMLGAPGVANTPKNLKRSGLAFDALDVFLGLVGDRDRATAGALDWGLASRNGDAANGNPSPHNTMHHLTMSATDLPPSSSGCLDNPGSQGACVPCPPNLSSDHLHLHLPVTLNSATLNTGRQLVYKESSSGSLVAVSEAVVVEQLQKAAPTSCSSGPGRILIFRGLRVRVGIASGIEAAGDVHYNPALGRTQYGGRLAVAAKAIQDCAQGGMVLCSSDTYCQLSMESMRFCLVALSMGEHMVKEGSRHKGATGWADHQQIYQLLHPDIVYRAAHLGPVRSLSQRGGGVLMAPFGYAAIAFMGVVGLASLEAWDSDITHQAVSLYQEITQELLAAAGGYLVEAADGLVLAAFTRPSVALRWALDCLASCLAAAWPDKLLLHELGEEVSASTPSSLPSPMLLPPNGTPLATAPSAATPAGSSPLGVSSGTGTATTRHKTRHSSGAARVCPLRVTQLLFRGLRIKCGVDYGPVKVDINAVSARAAYRGKVMNRAARIGTAAKSGQVWTSESAWEAAQSDINAGVHRLSPCGSLGQNVSGSIAALGFESGMHCAKPQSMARAATLAAAAGAAASSSGSVSASSVGVPTVEVHIQGLEQEVVEEQAAKKVREVMAAPLGPFKLKGISDEMHLFRCLFVD